MDEERFWKIIGRLERKEVFFQQKAYDLEEEKRQLALDFFKSGNGSDDSLIQMYWHRVLPVAEINKIFKKRYPKKKDKLCDFVAMSWYVRCKVCNEDVSVLFKSLSNRERVMRKRGGFVCGLCKIHERERNGKV